MADDSNAHALAAMPPKVEAPAADEADTRSACERLCTILHEAGYRPTKRFLGAAFLAYDYARRLYSSHPTADAVPLKRWQPIETCEAAGQAETVIVAVTCPDRGTVVGEAWRADDGEWWWAGTTPSDYHDGPIREINFGDVTHWMPMPEAPAAIRSGGQQ